MKILFFVLMMLSPISVLHICANENFVSYGSSSSDDDDDDDLKRGRRGQKGPTGATGANGLKGATGAAGSTGSIGGRGATGATGQTGAIGATGASGASGPVNSPTYGFFYTKAVQFVFSGFNVNFTDAPVMAGGISFVLNQDKIFITDPGTYLVLYGGSISSQGPDSYMLINVNGAAVPLSTTIASTVIAPSMHSVSSIVTFLNSGDFITLGASGIVSIDTGPGSPGAVTAYLLLEKLN